MVVSLRLCIGNRVPMFCVPGSTNDDVDDTKTERPNTDNIIFRPSFRGSHKNSVSVERYCYSYYIVRTTILTH